MTRNLRKQLFRLKLRKLENRMSGELSLYNYNLYCHIEYLLAKRKLTTFAT